MNIYAFDVDNTLAIPAMTGDDGPIGLEQLIRLKSDGHVIGLNGNWARVVHYVRGWHNLFSFIGPCGISKGEFLVQLKTYILADRYVMVGNDIDGAGNIAPDRDAAKLAGWEFIREKDFKEGL